MATDPQRWVVRPSSALLEHARTIYGRERGPDGSPSYDDFFELMVPHLVEAASVAWHNAQPVPGFEGTVREFVTRPHVMFGPARVTGYDDGETVWLIGFQADDYLWREHDE